MNEIFFLREFCYENICFMNFLNESINNFSVIPNKNQIRGNAAKTFDPLTNHTSPIPISHKIAQTIGSRNPRNKSKLNQLLQERFAKKCAAPPKNAIWKKFTK